MNSPCPTAERLQAFSIGDVSSLSLTRLTEHIAACPKCEMALAEFDDQADDLIEGLQAGLSHLGSTVSCQPVPEVLLDVARSCHRGKPPAQLDLDPGFRLARELEAGASRLGRFELQAELGVGSYGHVFRAVDTELQRTVAIKIQRAGNVATREEAERFLQEARAIASLKHPGIVGIYDSVQTDDHLCYIVTEFIDGESLESRLQGSPLGAEEAARLVSRIANALDYAHQHGVIHRDIKPSNILIDEQGQPHLMDFGLAKSENDGTLTSDGQILGTPAYMSPEQAQGLVHQLDARSDLFSLGVVLYEMLTGERPFQGNRRLLMWQLIHEPPVSLRQLAPLVPRDLETICLKLLSKSPGRRYASASELEQDLARFRRGEPIRARRTGLLERTVRWCRRYPLAASLLLAGPIGTLVGFAYLTWLSTYLVQQTALEGTRMEANMLEAINEYYSEEVVGRLDWKQIKVTHEYQNLDQTLPLPFTFMIDAGQRITENQDGMQVRIYSRHPWRKEGGPRDGFEERALDWLRSQPTDTMQEYHEFEEGADGPLLRYGRAQVMQESCVKCHNEHLDSPRKDWQVGDLAGVLSVTRPLESDIQRTRSGLKSAFYAVGLTAASLMTLSLVVFWTTRRRPGRLE